MFYPMGMEIIREGMYGYQACSWKTSSLDRVRTDDLCPVKAAL